MSVAEFSTYKRKRKSLVRWALRQLRPVGLRPFLTVGGFGFLSAAAYTVAFGLGLAATGVSLLVLEYLSGE